MDVLGHQDLKYIFAGIKDIMAENEDYLFKLDSLLGDGDLGLTMKNGFSKVDEVISGYDEKDVGKIFIKVGMTLASTVPSTMGTLMATGFMRAGKAIKEKTSIKLTDLVLMFRAFTGGIMERGKSKPGEKTIIDTIYPATDALEDALNKNKGLGEAFSDAYAAGRKGLESTRYMTAVHGKAVYHIERAAGTEDPGAAAGLLLFEGFNSYLNNI